MLISRRAKHLTSWMMTIATLNRREILLAISGLLNKASSLSNSTKMRVITMQTTEHAKKKIDVLGKSMAYVEVGEGDPIVFQHGIPTSSYLWRNIMPYTADLGRCIALDLIGMGDSDKLENSGPDSYTFAEHSTYFEAALDALGISDNVTFVIHDWGTALGFHWANRHRTAVKGICYMEGMVRPVSWDEWPEAARDVFQGFRSPAGETMVLENNVFVENVLPGSIIRDLSKEEMDVYRRPFLQSGEDRRPTLTWPRQIPLNGEPADVTAIAESYAEWLSKSDVPKLFINAEPGAILTGPQREFCRSWPNQTEVTVRGSHFIQEDSPDEIGQALRDWLSDL
jgi:haloalkane dehalogenase